MYTAVENRPSLTEFARTVGADISVVNPPVPVDVLGLEDLAKAYCDPTYTQPPPARPERAAPPVVPAIRQTIQARLSAGETVSADALAGQWPDLSPSTIRHHILRVRRDMAQTGRLVVRVGVGQYRIAGSP
jgi:hypothetical protein